MVDNSMGWQEIAAVMLYYGFVRVIRSTKAN